MKITRAPLSVLLVALLPLTFAWDEDDRCRRRRRLASNSTDPRLLEDGLTVEGIRSRPRVHENVTTMIPRHLRGSRRQLKDITTFQLKMYHEEGYCWQDEWEDRKWCLECEGSKCEKDDYLWVKRCDDDEKEQRFIYRPVSGTDGGQLSPYSRQDLCWERTRVNAHQLRPCSNYFKQIIVGIRFDGRFEMHPNRRPEACLEQHHDPKDEEIVRANECEHARNDNTNFWIMINKQTGTDEGYDYDGDDDPNDDDGGGGNKEIKYLGREYCDSNTCGECEGDCDGDSSCAGSLRCFQRDGNEPVPGCTGGGGSDLRGRDFCYRP